MELSNFDLDSLIKQAAWWFADHLLWLYLLLIICDVLTGWASASITGGLSSKVSSAGLQKKLLMFFSAAGTMVLGPFLARLSGDVVKPEIVDLATAGYLTSMCVTELLSIRENLEKAGIMLPFSPIKDKKLDQSPDKK